MEPLRAERTQQGMGVDWSDCDDAAVWAEVVAGDPSATGEIFDRHADRVFAHCARLLPVAADAEDAASVVFLEAWRKGAGVRFVDGSLLPWLLAVGTNTVRNLSRAQRRYRHHLARLPTSPPEADFADDLVADLDHGRERGRLAVALADLSVPAREVVALCDLSGLSYDEAAAALGVPVGTVRSRLSRARAELRRRLDPPVTAIETDTGQRGRRP